MDRMCNGNAGIFIPVVQKNTLEASLGRVYEKTPVWRIMWQTKGRKQARYVCAVAQLVFHVEKGSKVFVPIPETGDPYIFLDSVPLVKLRSQELWLLFWKIQITSKIIQVFLRNPVWLIATYFWICWLSIFQIYWLGRIPSWRHFFIWWGYKILINWGCGHRKILWMGNGSHSRTKVGIFDFFPRCIETSYIS